MAEASKSQDSEQLEVIEKGKPIEDRQKSCKISESALIALVPSESDLEDLTEDPRSSDDGSSCASGVKGCEFSESETESQNSGIPEDSAESSSNQSSSRSYRYLECLLEGSQEVTSTNSNDAFMLSEDDGEGTEKVDDVVDVGMVETVSDESATTAAATPATSRNRFGSLVTEPGSVNINETLMVELQELEQNSQQSNIIGSSSNRRRNKKRTRNQDSLVSENYPFQNLKCRICQEAIVDRVIVPECHHAFCHECLSTWLETNNGCPICMVTQETYQLLEEANVGSSDTPRNA